MKLILITIAMLVSVSAEAGGVDLTFKFHDNGVIMENKTISSELEIPYLNILKISKQNNTLTIVLIDKTIRILVSEKNQNLLNQLYVRLKYRDGVSI